MSIGGRACIRVGLPTLEDHAYQTEILQRGVELTQAIEDQLAEWDTDETG